MRKRRLIQWTRGFGAAALAVAVSAGPAGAFYWYGPPPKTIVPPDKPGNPPGNPPPIEVPPPGSVPPSEVVPEPATALAALAGLGALAAARAWRKRRSRLPDSVG